MPGGRQRTSPASSSRLRSRSASGFTQADKQEGRREEAAPGLAASERDELARLRREVRQLRVERDILSKAAAWFARAQAAAQLEGTLPFGSSGS